MQSTVATTWRFKPREHPDPVDYVRRSVTSAPYRYLARVRVHAPAAQLRSMVPPQVGQVEDDGDGWCVFVLGGDSLDWIAAHLARLGFEARVLEPPELRDALVRLASRLTAMAS
jgi:predicted DNA-binding transcriptional regulator YafY